MKSISYTLTVFDPKFVNPRHRRLQTHTDMESEVAREMVDIYLALDYPLENIQVTTDFEAPEAENAAA